MTPSWARSGVLEEPNDLTNRWKCRCTNEWGRWLEHVMDFIVHGKVQLVLILTAKRISKTASSRRRWVFRWLGVIQSAGLRLLVELKAS